MLRLQAHSGGRALRRDWISGSAVAEVLLPPYLPDRLCGIRRPPSGHSRHCAVRRTSRWNSRFRKTHWPAVHPDPPAKVQTPAPPSFPFAACHSGFEQLHAQVPGQAEASVSKARRRLRHVTSDTARHPLNREEVRRQRRPDRPFSFEPASNRSNPMMPLIGNGRSRIIHQ